ncbi:MAG: hypothetical protein DBX55_07185 [Verrucomicrobia bacterium]|nr:MAG: hypothetical protein DBX55_07185 [Verrucomicrobiota bacterium]
MEIAKLAKSTLKIALIFAAAAAATASANVQNGGVKTEKSASARGENAAVPTRGNPSDAKASTRPDAPAREQIKFESFVNPDWEKWSERSYYYGMDKNKVPVPLFFDSSISTDATIMVRGNNSHKKRWGLHVFEAYANDDKSRITMILNKHVEEGLPVAELYYYASVYGQGLNAYNWFRIGSDVPYHSYMFSRDRAIFYGEVEMRNIFRLDNIGKDDLLDKMPPKEQIRERAKKLYPRENFKSSKDCDHARAGVGYLEEAKVLKKRALKNAKDGSIFYDKDNHIVVIKVDGKWKRLPTVDLPANVSYED